MLMVCISQEIQSIILPGSPMASDNMHLLTCVKDTCIRVHLSSDTSSHWLTPYHWLPVVILGHVIILKCNNKLACGSVI